MSGTTSTFANDLLKLFFQGTAIPNIADNASSSPLTNLHLSLHTADPGPAGNQTTNECAYAGYGRQARARTAGGFTVTGNVVKPSATVVFGTCTGGSENATHYGIGTDPSGAGKLLYSGPLSPIIAISNTIVPKIQGSSTITIG